MSPAINGSRGRAFTTATVIAYGATSTRCFTRTDIQKSASRSTSGSDPPTMSHLLLALVWVIVPAALVLYLVIAWCAVRNKVWNMKGGRSGL